MNANELADEFKEENNNWNEDNLRHWGRQAEAMLRQQQAEIESLKAKDLKKSNAISHLNKQLKRYDDLGFKQIQLNADLLRKAQENG